MTKLISLAVVLILSSASAALAHHPLGGMTPQTIAEGLLSGIGHPVIGFDHLAFVIGVGLLAAFHKNRLLLPAMFVFGTIAGTLLTVSMVVLPLAEIVITLSVVGVGAFVMRGKVSDLRWSGGLALAAGLFHGGAYGAAVAGGEATPIIAYLVGFAGIQLAIAFGVAMITNHIWKAVDAGALHPRLAGAIIAGVGVTYLVENVEGLIFAGV